MRAATLRPVTPEVGNPFLLAKPKLQPLALIHEKRPRKEPFLISAVPKPSLEWFGSSFGGVVSIKLIAILTCVKPEYELHPPKHPHNYANSRCCFCAVRFQNFPNR